MANEARTVDGTGSNTVEDDDEIPKVYHLEGGILAYLDNIKPSESKYDGECYVFDQRVAVTYGCQPSTKYKQSCHACRHPLSIDEMDPLCFYVEGLSCKYCYHTLTDKQKERFGMRQKQIESGLHDFYTDPNKSNQNKNGNNQSGDGVEATTTTSNPSESTNQQP